MNRLVQTNTELREHYYESHGEEIIERWEEDEKTLDAKKEFDKSLAASTMDLDDPIF